MKNSLLFLPMTVDGKLSKPVDKILPWSKNMSWSNFWKTFHSSQNATNQYMRSIWCIFQNMVDNMRLGEHEKTLVTKWRFSEADGRPKQQAPQDCLKKNQRTIRTNMEEVNENDLAVICELFYDKPVFILSNKIIEKLFLTDPISSNSTIL